MQSKQNVFKGYKDCEEKIQRVGRRDYVLHGTFETWILLQIFWGFFYQKFHCQYHAMMWLSCIVHPSSNKWV